MDGKDQLPQLDAAHKKRLIAWLEAAGISVCVPAIGYLADRSDPFFVQASFPWLALAPLLVGLRYGVAPGFASATGLVGGLALFWKMSALPAQAFPMMHSAALFLIALICGQFRDQWERERGRLYIGFAYLSDRLQQLTRSYGLLMASHVKLEQKLGGTAVSMRAALTGAREKLLAASLGSEPSKWLGEQMLSLFSEYGGVRTAALYQCVTPLASTPDRNHGISLLEVARLGQVSRLAAENPLLLQVLQSGNAAVAAPEQLSASRGVRAIIPIAAVDGGVWGVVAITEMAFLDYNNRTFELLALIGAYLSDAVNAASIGGDDERRSNITMDGALGRWSSNVHRYGTAVTVALLTSGDERMLSAACSLLRARSRLLDHVWLRPDRPGSTSGIALFPLTDESGVMTCLRRVEEELYKADGQSFQSAGIRVEIILLKGEDDAATLLSRMGGRQGSWDAETAAGGIGIALAD
jgi:hypothetical protein